MKIAVMQPYFFPYVGYFSLIKASDIFVACDEVQHIKQGWVHRNRILSLDKEFAYIRTVLNKASQHKKIKEIQMVEDESWKVTLKQHLMVYKNRAPYYNEAINVIEQCLAYKEVSLCRWNVHALEVICDYLNIAYDIRILSSMDVQYEDVCEADEWGLNLTVALGGNEYINAPGGAEFYDAQKYHSKDVKIYFVKNRLSPYDQKLERFVPGLSIIDVLMFNSPEEINKMIDDYELWEGK